MWCRFFCLVKDMGRRGSRCSLRSLFGGESGCEYECLGRIEGDTQTQVPDCSVRECGCFWDDVVLRSQPSSVLSTPA